MPPFAVVSSEQTTSNVHRTSLDNIEPTKTTTKTTTTFKRPRSQGVETNKTKKSVSFSHVKIREHTIIVGDHPCASSLPLSLGWQHSQTSTISCIDTYERTRGPCRRRGTDLCMPYYEKKNMLRRISGMSEMDIRKAERRVQLRSLESSSNDSSWSGSGNDGGVGKAGKEGRMHRVKTLETIRRMEYVED